DGTAPLPAIPLVRTTVASTVGWPRESRISRASTRSIVVVIGNSSADLLRGRARVTQDDHPDLGEDRQDRDDALESETRGRDLRRERAPVEARASLRVDADAAAEPAPEALRGIGMAHGRDQRSPGERRERAEHARPGVRGEMHQEARADD